MNYDGPSYYKKKMDQETELTKEEEAHLTPPPSQPAKKTIESSKELKRNEHFFRSRKIPASLQNLNGWKKTEWNQSLLAELEERLFKEEDDYLLFSPEIKEEKKQEVKKLSISSNEEKKLKSQEKINKVQNKMKQDLNKPATGLHRSLSKIIAEDQEALKNGKSNLDSLFI